MYFLSCPVGGLAAHYEMQLAALGNLVLGEPTVI
jgi:hypothetical protein